MLKVGVIGAGRMGKIRALAASELGAAVDFIYDPDTSRAIELSRIVGARAVFEEKDLSLDGLDALFLCTPPADRDMGVHAIEKGICLMMEKPLGLSAQGGSSFLKALDKTPVINAVGFMNRYRESINSARAFFEYEEPLAVSLRWFGGRYHVPWWADPKQSGGPINEQCSHLVDLCRYLMGEVIAVQAFVDKNGEAPESLALNLRFASGQLGTLLYSCKAAEKNIGLHMISANRDIKLEGWDFHLTESKNNTADKNEIFKVETRAFLDAVVTKDASAVRSDIKDAFRTQLVVDAILKSANAQMPVEIY